MLIAMALFAVGFAVSFVTQVLLLVPIAVAVIIGFVGLWFALGELDFFKIAILIGYLFALNAGYLVGAAIAASRRGR